MKKLTCSAIALTMTCAAGFASDGEWSALDQEVGALASTLSLDGGPTVSGDLRTGYVSSSDLDANPDTGGFSVDQARVAVSGSNGDYGYRIDFDFAATGGLRDAYATFSIADSVSATMGQFRASVCSDADKDENDMDHFYHSLIGGAYAGFTSGLGLSGDAGSISWALSIMNGQDGVADENAMIMRASMDLMDGGDGGMSVSAGVAIVDEGDGTFDDMGGTIIEVSAGDGTWGIGIETMSTDDGGAGNFGAGSFAAGEAIDLGSGVGVPGGIFGDTSPMAISASYNVNDTWSVAVRSTDYDFFGVETMEITATNTVSEGVRWQIGQTEMDSDLSDSASLIQVGLGISF